MKIEEAIFVIRDPKAAWQAKVEAAGLLTSTSATPLEYLVECLKIKGLPAEMAATKLYTRTKRPRENDSLESFSTNAQDWQDYLNQNA